MMQKKVWFITGCSTGFGRFIAKAAIEAGNQVVVTARNRNAILDFLHGNESKVLALELDVTNKEQVKKAISDAIERFSRIDVLVNNAGIGYFSSVEEGIEEETRRMFEINFWGLMNVTNAVLPYMREQREGHIFNFSSIGGLASFPSLGYYHATKYAVEGISESLSQEVAPFNIKVTLVEPSSFRTDWAGRSSIKTMPEIDEYKTIIEPMLAASGKGNEAGDPEKAAKAIMQIADSENPPLRILLGKAAYYVAANKFSDMLKNIENWKDITLNADYEV